MHFQSVALSDRGLNREINEDSAWIGSQIIAVADGLGGHAGGEVASAIVINRDNRWVVKTCSGLCFAPKSG